MSGSVCFAKTAKVLYTSLILPVNDKKHTANPGNPLANRGAVTAVSKPHPQEPARRWTRPSASKIITIKGNNKKNKNGENKINKIKINKKRLYRA